MGHNPFLASLGRSCDFCGFGSEHKCINPSTATYLEHMCANFSCHSCLGCFSWCFLCHSPLCNQDCCRAFCCYITPAQTITETQTKIIFSARDHYLNCHFSPVLLHTIPSPYPKTCQAVLCQAPSVFQDISNSSKLSQQAGTNPYIYSRIGTVSISWLITPESVVSQRVEQVVLPNLKV